ncbi:MAG: lytic transglycosylase domain-containing protein [Thermodesulfobacteriota bacterium]|nr:lytic transglycosylase domain-containing protein [Thermodesulfobacteriota bacterium]
MLKKRKRIAHLLNILLFSMLIGSSCQYFARTKPIPEIRKEKVPEKIIKPLKKPDYQFINSLPPLEKAYGYISVVMDGVDNLSPEVKEELTILFLSLVKKESSFRPRVISKFAGEVGYFQISPTTATELGIHPSSLYLPNQYFDFFQDGDNIKVQFKTIKSKSGDFSSKEIKKSYAGSLKTYYHSAPQHMEKIDVRFNPQVNTSLGITYFLNNYSWFKENGFPEKEARIFSLYAYNLGITAVRYMVSNHRIKTEESLLKYLKRHKTHFVYQKLNGEKKLIEQDKVNLTINYVPTIKKYYKEYKDMYSILKYKIDSRLFLSAKGKY